MTWAQAGADARRLEQGRQLEHMVQRFHALSRGAEHMTSEVVRGELAAAFNGGKESARTLRLMVQGLAAQLEQIEKRLPGADR